MIVIDVFEAKRGAEDCLNLCSFVASLMKLYTLKCANQNLSLTLRGKCDTIFPSCQYFFFCSPSERHLFSFTHIFQKIYVVCLENAKEEKFSTSRGDEEKHKKRIKTSHRIM